MPGLNITRSDSLSPVQWSPIESEINDPVLLACIRIARLFSEMRINQSSFMRSMQEDRIEQYNDILCGEHRKKGWTSGIIGGLTGVSYVALGVLGERSTAGALLKGATQFFPIAKETLNPFYDADITSSQHALSMAKDFGLSEIQSNARNREENERETLETGKRLMQLKAQSLNVG